MKLGQGIFVVIMTLLIIYGVPACTNLLAGEEKEHELTNRDFVDTVEYVDEKIKNDKMNKKWGE